MKERVKRKVIDDLEGKCLGNKGYLIFIVDIHDSDIHPGLIDNDTGGVYVTVYYSAVMMRPFKNEVLDAVVTSASDVEGFTCSVGPLEIFVSRHCIPDDMHFSFETSDCWISEDGAVEIKEESIVRLRIIGVDDIGADKIIATGSIKDGFLGLIQ